MERSKGWDWFLQVLEAMMERPVIYHGTPLTPRSALLDICPGRAMCISFYSPQDVEAAETISPYIMYDNGAFSFWKQAQRSGEEWASDRDWSPYYEWLEVRLFHPGRWAVIPDMPGAPSQINDTLLPEWPFGQKGAPLWHMDGPIERLLRLCDRYDRVCMGWVGPGKGIDCPAYHQRMEEVSRALGNRWPVLHMMRGTAVAYDYPFYSADSTSLAQNGWRYDTPLYTEEKWKGRKTYAEKLENPDWSRSRVLRRSHFKGRSDAWAHMGSDSMVERDARCREEAARSRQIPIIF